MKLCLVTHSFAKGSGQGRVNYEVALEVLRQGHFLTLVASDVAPDLQQHPSVCWIPIDVRHYPTELLRNMVFSVRSKAWLVKHRQEFDLVVANGAITDVDIDINAAHFVHSSWLQSPAHSWKQHKTINGLYQGIYTAINSVWEKRAFNRSHRVVAVSQRVKNELIAIGLPSDRIHVILNGVDVNEFAPQPVNRKLLNLPTDIPLAFFAGDIQTSRKNLDTVLRALVAVPDLHLAVAGAVKTSPYPHLAQELGLAERVHFLDYRKDINRLMQAADFFVFPSRYEACTLVLLEAMATGLPVITAETAGGAEIVQPGSGFVLQNPNDVDALGEAMRLLATSPEQRQQMGAVARSIAQRHSWERMAKEYLHLFEEIYRLKTQSIAV